MCVLSFTKVSLMNVAALAFGAQIFRNERSYWKILPLMNMKYPSLSFLISLGWELILVNIGMFTAACFLGPFAWKTFFPSFYFEIVSIFVVEVCFLYAAKCWILFVYPAY